MDRTDSKKRLLAAKTLLLEPTTTREKFSHIRSLIVGINPKLDVALAEADKHITEFEKYFAGDIIRLSIENQPEDTEDEKKRKKYLLLIWGSWKNLKSEIARVEKELDASNQSQNVGDKASHWGKIFGAAKGPFGIITILAVVAVVALQMTSVHLTIQNQGCGTFELSASVPIPLPGFSLPTGPIASGDTAVATIPPLMFHIDGTSGNTISIKAVTFTAAFNLPGNIKSVTLNGKELLGAQSDISLFEAKEHQLNLVCT